MKSVYHQVNWNVVAKTGTNEMRLVPVQILTNVLPIIIIVTLMPNARTLMVVLNVLAGRVSLETVQRVS